MSQPSRVFVDATSIPEDRGGVGRYLAHLLPELDRAGVAMSIAVNPRDREWMRSLLGPDAELLAPGASRRRLTRLLWEQFALPGAVVRSGAAVLFSPHYTMPLRPRRPVVVTMHDATFFSHPQHHSRLKRTFFRAWTRISARRAAVVIVPSNATADELRSHLKHPPIRLRTVHHGVDRALFFPPSEQETSAAGTRVGSSEWLTYLGTVEPRKNVTELVRAFERLAEDSALADGHSDLRLVVAGGRGWDDRAERAIRTSPVADRIRRLGFVPDGELRGLLGGAVAVAYPSSVEGFGLPVLEGMACGAPVVTTDSSALREVAGDAAVYARPTADDLARVLRDLILDRADRATHAAAGLARAAEFTWTRSAEGHSAAFREALA